MLIGTVLYAIGVGMLAFDTAAPAASTAGLPGSRPLCPTVYLIHMVFIEIAAAAARTFPEIAVRVLLPLLAIAARRSAQRGSARRGCWRGAPAASAGWRAGPSAGNAVTAARTSAGCSAGLTLSQRCTTRPSGPIR